MNIRTLKIWVVAVIVLELGGMLVLGGVGMYTSGQRSKADELRGKSLEIVSRQQQLWERWNALSDRDKRKLPWGSGKFAGPGKRKQREILTSYIEDVAGGSLKMPEQLAINLFGRDYHSAVREYKQREILLGATEMVAAWAIIAGAGMFTIYFPARSLLLGAWSLAGAVFRVFRGGKDRSLDEIFTVDTAEPFRTDGCGDGSCATGQSAKGREIDRDYSRKQSGQRASKEGMLGCFASNVCASENYSKDVAVSYNGAGSDVDDFDDTCEDSVSSSGHLQQKVVQQGGKAGVDTSRLFAPEPVDTAECLEELTEQVSAIRDFAAAQQKQVQKFQDGYDWIIIKRFCMRIIRCIDNLELRISRKTAGSDDARSLEEVRDELLFALESSGVERYSPEPGSEYRGNERQLEAVRDREPNNEPDRSGQVAEIIRSGYKYVVSDNEEKIVRTAQVRLYE